MRRGAASLTLLNSSPRSAPLAMACENWVMAPAAAAPVVPLMRRLAARASVMPATSRLVPPSLRTGSASRA